MNKYDLYIDLITKKVIFTYKAPRGRFLALSGGGIKGEAHKGALKAFEEAGKLQGIKAVAGTSIGAVIGMQLALGTSPKDIVVSKDELSLKNIMGIQDGGLISPKKFTQQLRKLIIKQLAWALELNLPHEVKARIKQGSISFADLETIRKCNNNSEKQTRELIVTATNLTQQKLEYFSHRTKANLDIATAVTISASFPRAFGKTTLNANVYVDGGVFNNTPAQAFEDAHYDNDDNLSCYVFMLEEAHSKDVIYSNKPVKTASSIGAKLANAWCQTNFIQKEQRLMNHLRDKYAQRTIILPTFGIGTLNPLADTAKLNKGGYEATVEYLKNHKDEIAYICADSIDALLEKISSKQLMALLKTKSEQLSNDITRKIKQALVEKLTKKLFVTRKHELANQTFDYLQSLQQKLHHQLGESYKASHFAYYANLIKDALVFNNYSKQVSINKSYAMPKDEKITTFLFTMAKQLNSSKGFFDVCMNLNKAQHFQGKLNTVQTLKDLEEAYTLVKPLIGKQACPPSTSFFKKSASKQEHRFFAEKKSIYQAFASQSIMSSTLNLPKLALA